VKAMIAALMALGLGVSPAAHAEPPGGPSSIQGLFAAYTPRTPGCAVGVEQDGKTLFQGGFGTADLERHAPITATTRFYMASVSKQLTALNIVLLAESGQIDLRASVRTYLPELPPYMQPVTILGMLTHTSGVRDYFQLAALSGASGDKAFTEKDVLDAVSAQDALNFEPGSEFLYSNSGYVLLAIVAERITGRSFNDLANQQVFAPLGMSSTFFQHHHDAVVPDKANGYAAQDKTWTISNSNLDVVGDGGLYSNVEDMLRWLKNLDSPTVGAEALKTMEIPFTLTNGKSTGYGMGLDVGTYRGLRVIEHGGALAGYRTADMWFPSEKFGVVVLCNDAGARPSDKVRKIAELYLAGRLAPAPVRRPAEAATFTPAPGELVPLAGFYRSPDGSYVDLVEKAGQLQLKGTTIMLRAVNRRVFIAADQDSEARITFDAGGTPAGLTLADGDEPATRFDRVTKTSFSAQERAALVGDYSSPGLNVTYHISDGPDGLTIAIGQKPPFPLKVVGPGRLLIDQFGAELSLSHDETGRVTGFSLDFGRVKHVRFHRI